MHYFVFAAWVICDGAGDGIPDSEPAREMDISDPRGSVFEL